jgi:hypothetical protein
LERHAVKSEAIAAQKASKKQRLLERLKESGKVFRDDDDMTERLVSQALYEINRLFGRLFGDRTTLQKSAHADFTHSAPVRLRRIAQTGLKTNSGLIC